MLCMDCESEIQIDYIIINTVIQKELFSSFVPSIYVWYVSLASAKRKWKYGTTDEFMIFRV